jgi:hypothetical protein
MNMKKLLLVIAYICNTANIMAQSQTGRLSIKPMVGVNFSGFSNAAIDIYQTKVGLTGGAELEYGVNPWLGLSLGLMYSQQGAKIDGSFDATVIDENGVNWYTKTQMDGKLKCNYLNLPLMANVYIPAVKGLAVKAGVQVGILASDKMTADVMLAMMNMDINYFELYEGPERTRLIDSHTDISDVCKSVDFGIPLGLSYEYKNIVLDARYFFGLTKIDKTDNPDSARNQYLSITLGYKFNL